MLRIKKLKDFIGQNEITDNLKVYIGACKKEDKVLDHCLLYGSPGLGKTSLANLIANELKVKIHSIHAGNLKYTSDVLTILTKIKTGDVLFIDEIHSLDNKIEELFYSVMENNYIDVILGKDISAKPIRLTVPKFTLIGATTQLGLIAKPLIDRFSIKFSFKTYSINSITNILLKISKDSKILLSEDVCECIATCSKNTPRIAKSIYRRIYDHALFENKECISIRDCKRYLKKIGIFKLGLNETEVKYLKYLSQFNKSVGLELICMYLNQPINTIKTNIEPYLVQSNLIVRTPSGRRLSSRGLSYLKEV